MFCLRSWVPLLVFLTNASPIYVLLFLTANYILQRPCVYCSILLFVLVFSLFDFNADWFEPRWQPSGSGPMATSMTGAANSTATGALPTLTEAAGAWLSGNATLAHVLSETAAFALAALNGTGGSLASAAIEGARRRVLGGESATAAVAASGAFDWLRGVLDRRQFRIPCVDVWVRL